MSSLLKSWSSEMNTKSIIVVSGLSECCRTLVVNLVAFIFCLTILWIGRIELSGSFLDRIEVGMPVDDVVVFLGRPTSDDYYKHSTGYHRKETIRQCEPYMEIHEELTPHNPWKKSIIINMPHLFPCEDWTINYCYFWEDGKRIFWITFDENRIVKSKRLSTISRNKSVMEYRLAEEWRNIKQKLQ